jgi:membrane associated rhomboid family serine protease
MGIQDRDYYRDENQDRLAFITSRTAAVWLVALLTMVWFLVVLTRQAVRGGMQPGPLTDALIFDSLKIADFELWRIGTGGFMHSPYDLFGMVVHMMVLWWAGDTLCKIYGNREFVGFFIAVTLLTTALAYLVTLLSLPARTYLGGPAILAVLTLYACHFPRERVLLFFVLPVPIWGLIILLLGMNLYSASKDVAPLYAIANLAGALFSVIYHQASLRITGGRRFAARRAPRVKLRVTNDSTHEIRIAASRDDEELEEPAYSVPKDDLESKLDDVLAKVQALGQASLTDAEKEVLLKASERFKRKRM